MALEVAEVEVEAALGVEGGALEVAAADRQPRELRPGGAAQLHRLRGQLEAVPRVGRPAEPRRGEAVGVVRERVVGVDREGPPREVERPVVVHRAIAEEREVAEGGDVVRVLLQARLEGLAGRAVGALAEVLLAGEPEAVDRAPVEVGRRLERPREGPRVGGAAPLEAVPDPHPQALPRDRDRARLSSRSRAASPGRRPRRRPCPRRGPGACRSPPRAGRGRRRGRPPATPR